MLKKIKTTWISLNKTITMSQRELLLGALACTMTGVVIGMLISPRKAVTIGSHNGNCTQSPGTEPAEETADES